MAGSNVNKLKQPSPMAFTSTSLFRPRNLVIFAPVIAVISLVYSWSNGWSSFRANTAVFHQIYSFEIVNEFPHNTTAYTEGLLYAGNGTLFESTGFCGQSSVRKVDLETGKIEAIHKMNDSYFGEGLTLLDERLYQVNFKTNIGFIYDQHNLSKFETFYHHMKDGWGLTTNGTVLFGTDGSSSLYHIDPRDMNVSTKHIVKYNGQEVSNLNELEYINNEVWANVWLSDCIARISPLNGTVIGWILLHELRKKLMMDSYCINVLNGIAWDSEKNRIFVTGKLWPNLYEIKLKQHTKPLPAPIEQICFHNPAYFATI